ncbi:hypothetical protein G4Z16_02760 [Streptomyces bathyalis]|uniref:Uncharacterized protein n=1 Tax=Streptomyces bathyalis TaxID=2710756 RepID=A0A7T1T315_9ACTN|nr:hypothetical protein [Streptomyces bathyalis]QPP05492.1 hypothetical protein G4Z16_02760 [Streptomyces bathyalis]
MAFLLAVDAVLLLIIGSLVWVLARRNRRRRVTSADGLRIEAAAGAEAREARRRARAGRDMRTGSTAPYMRDR